MPQTPRLVVDGAKMRRNIEGMAAVARGRGVDLRPHVKTHKIPEIAHEQLRAGASGITVAKVSEAEVMAEGGVGDIFIAFPLVTQPKIRRAIRLARDISLTLGVDSLEGARRLSELATAEGATLNVRLEADTGLGRTGVRRERAADLALEIAGLDNLALAGIYTYRGYVLKDGSPTLDLEEAGLEEGNLMVALAEEIRARGVEVRDVSLGSTPTAEHAAKVESVTEVRPGTYVFYDRMQARLGACSLDECAASVVATVVSRPKEDLAIIDGGSKTFATDVQPGTQPLNLRGFGHVVGHPDAVLERVTEEHGMMRVDKSSDLGVGDEVRIIPNHVCSTVNLHNTVVLEEANGARRLEVAARGKLE